MIKKSKVKRDIVLKSNGNTQVKIVEGNRNSPSKVEVVVNEEESQHKPPKELKALEVFLGRWLIKGSNMEGAPVCPHESIIGEEIYEWLPGRYFFIGKFLRQFSDAEHKGISIIGYDTSTKSFTASNFDNMGNARVYQLTHDQFTWHLTGDKERAMIEFSPNESSFTVQWEIRQGKEWKPLCYLEGIRVDA